MKILGNRILVSKIEEEKKDGFQTVDVQDSFVYKGKVEQTSSDCPQPGDHIHMQKGDTVLFAKYSPDTKEVDHEGKKMKIISMDDVLAIL